MAQEKTYVALYAIGKHSAGAKLKLDPEGKEAKRLLNAKAIATEEELAKLHPYAKSDDQADARVAELEKALEEREADFKVSEEERIALEEKVKQAETTIAELEHALETAKADAAKPASKAAK